MSAPVELGQIVGTHGVRGEVRALRWLDAPLWQGLSHVQLGGRDYTLRAARPHKQFMLLSLEGVDSVDDALALRGQVLTVAREALQLGEGKYLYRDLYGFSVFDMRTGAVIGTLREVRETPASMLYVVDLGGREALIPAVPAFERGVDFAGRVLTLETIEGMLE